MSCAAATSTARQLRIEAIASRRAAATWQSVMASDPMERTRCAASSRSSAASRIQRGSADSMPSSSSLPSGVRRSAVFVASCRPPRKAPSPRSACHASPGPKSCTKPKTTSAMVGPSATAIDRAWCESPRLALSEPSIGSITTTIPSPP
jgi:hypothetical protein